MIYSQLLDVLPEIDENVNIFVKNDEKYIDFTVKGREFTVNLVEHRPKKG